MIFVMKLRLHEERCSAVTFCLAICFGEISQNVHNFSCRSLKSREKRDYKGSFLAIWSYELFLSTGTREGTNTFNGFTNFRKFHLRRRDKSCSKDPYFLSAVIVVYKQSLCERDKSNCGKSEICIVDIRTNSARCICKDGYKGKPCGK